MRKVGFARCVFTAIACSAMSVSVADQQMDMGGQASRGQKPYEVRCASCHGVDLGGGSHAPPLIGSGFRSHFEGKPARSVYSRIISTMPQDDPGSLSESEALAIALFVLARNDIAVGAEPIGSAAALGGITIPIEKTHD